MSGVSLPLSGFSGWHLLQKTKAAQGNAINNSLQNKRAEAYFKENISSVKTAAQLVSDRQLLAVTLGAFGLADDINNTYFITRVLSDGTLETSDLANRLANKSYAAMSAEFGFGDYSTPRTGLSDFADRILEKFRRHNFEIAVGEVNSDYRIALHSQVELPQLAKKSISEEAKWYNVLGSAPLRSLFETVFGLPDSFGAIDIDQQLSVMQDKAKENFGETSLIQFENPETLDLLVKKFILRSELATFSQTNMSGSAAALQILQAGTGNRARLGS